MEMFLSTKEDSGFSAIGQEELEDVNGGFIETVIILGSLAAGVVSGYFLQKSNSK
jgi:lactobin A/cerein 7B family class IIb bacteriocin